MEETESKYTVIIDAICVKNKIIMDGYGNTKKEAEDSAIENLMMLKHNDIEVISVEKSSE